MAGDAAERLADRDVLAEVVEPLGAVLRRAARSGAIVAWFQPQLDLASGRIVGAEALARWHDDNSNVPRSGVPHFAVLYEREGLEALLTDRMLECACRAGTGGEIAGTVAVNITAADLADLAFPERVASALARFGLPASRLELELTERVALERSDAVETVLATLREMGVAFALDDFGTGAASIEYLRWLHPEVIKVPREYVAEIDDPLSRSGAIGRACLAFVREMGAEIVVEGVENASILARCRRLGATRAQGYHIGRPVSVDTYRRELERRGHAQ